jgi:hypothetical protein
LRGIRVNTKGTNKVKFALLCTQHAIPIKRIVQNKKKAGKQVKGVSPSSVGEGTD